MRRTITDRKVDTINTQEGSTKQVIQNQYR